MVLFPLGYDVFNGFKFRRHSNRDTMYMFHTNTYDDIIAKTDLLQSRRLYCVVTTKLNRKQNSHRLLLPQSYHTCNALWRNWRDSAAYSRQLSHYSCARCIARMRDVYSKMYSVYLCRAVVKANSQSIGNGQISTPHPGASKPMNGFR